MKDMAAALVILITVMIGVFPVQVIRTYENISDNIWSGWMVWLDGLVGWSGWMVWSD
jgi:hypothetical protein